MNTSTKSINTDMHGIAIEVGQDVKDLYIEDEGYTQFLYVDSIDADKGTVTLKECDEDKGYIVPCEDIEIKLSNKEIAEHKGLEVIETTTGRNGYPENLEFAIVGFDNFEDAQNLADKYNLKVESFTKKDGWDLWQRSNNWMYEPYKLNVDQDFGDNYNEVDADVIIDAIKDNIDNLEYKDVPDFLREQASILEEIENAEDDEVVVTYMGEYYNTLPRESMSFYHDTRHYVIGLI